MPNIGKKFERFVPQPRLTNAGLSKTPRFKALMTMKMRLLTILLTASAASSWAAPVLNPANGHYYDIVPTTTLNWTQSRAAAASASHLGAPGYLATITSQQEQEFIVATFPAAANGYFLGGFQENSIDWLWVSGEPFVYSNWFPGEPNNFQGNQEDYLQFHGFLQDNNPTGFWNDVGDFPGVGYVVEFEPASVPDGGSSAGLIALGLGSLACFSQRIQRRPGSTSEALRQ